MTNHRKAYDWQGEQIGDARAYLDDDIIVLGSDAEDSPTTKAERERRRAAIGQRYLQGHVPYIQSACLRGPFDAKSGWINPWKRQQREPSKRSTSIRSKHVANSTASPCTGFVSKVEEDATSLSIIEQEDIYIEESALRLPHSLPLNELRIPRQPYSKEKDSLRTSHTVQRMNHPAASQRHDAESPLRGGYEETALPFFNQRNGSTDHDLSGGSYRQLHGKSPEGGQTKRKLDTSWLSGVHFLKRQRQESLERSSLDRSSPTPAEGLKQDYRTLASPTSSPLSIRIEKPAETSRSSIHELADTQSDFYVPSVPHLNEPAPVVQDLVNAAQVEASGDTDDGSYRTASEEHISPSEPETLLGIVGKDIPLMDAIADDVSISDNMSIDELATPLPRSMSNIASAASKSTGPRAGSQVISIGPTDVDGPPVYDIEVEEVEVVNCGPRDEPDDVSTASEQDELSKSPVPASTDPVLSHNTNMSFQGFPSTQVLVDEATANPWNSSRKKSKLRRSTKRVSFGGYSDDEATTRSDSGYKSAQRIGSPLLPKGTPRPIELDDDFQYTITRTSQVVINEESTAGIATTPEEGAGTVRSATKSRRTSSGQYIPSENRSSVLPEDLSTNLETTNTDEVDLAPPNKMTSLFDSTNPWVDDDSPSSPLGASFSIDPSGKITAVHFELGATDELRSSNDEFQNLDAMIDDVGSFFKGWDVDAELRRAKGRPVSLGAMT
jgi:hypothetical protein